MSRNARCLKYGGMSVIPDRSVSRARGRKLIPQASKKSLDKLDRWLCFNERI